MSVMSVCMETRGGEATESDSTVEMDISTCFGSCKFLERTIPLSIATILHLRCKFNPEFVKHRTLEEVPYVGFHSNAAQNRSLRKFLRAVKLMKRCILNKSLRGITVRIIDRETNDTLESFIFKLTYRSDDGTFKHGKSSSKIASKFFEKINRLGLRQTPEERIRLSFDFRFYNKMPAAEVKMIFKPRTGESRVPGTVLEIASLKTPFHKLDVLLERSSS